MDRRSVLHRSLLLLALIVAVAAFGPGLRAPFHFDDIDSIERNPSIGSVARALTPPRQIAVSGRPVVNVSFALNRRLGDPVAGEVLGIRVVNLAIHLTCGLLVYALVGITARRQTYDERIADQAEPLALFAAAVWLLHPIQTEVVHYATQRTESLMALFFLTAMYASARAHDATTRARRVVWYLVGITSSLLGMGSKESMVVLPLLVLLYDRAFRYESWRQVAGAAERRIYYAGLFATTSWAVILAAGQPRSASVGFGLGVTSWDYLQSQGWAIPHYFRLGIWPVGLSIDYGPNPVLGSASIAGVVALILAAFLTLLAWRRADKYGWLGFLGAWIYLTLGPSSSIVPITTEVAAERRMYLPMVAVVVAAGLGFAAIQRRWPPAGRPAMTLAVLACAALAFVTRQRSLLFTDLEGLWRQAVRNAPFNPRAPENLATVILQQDSSRTAEAVALLRESLERDSTYGSAWHQLGVLALNDDQLDAAAQYLGRAYSINPNHPEVLAELGHVSLRRADTVAAMRFLQQSAARAANDTVLIQLAQIEAAAGHPEAALRSYQRVLEVNPARTDVARFVAAHLIETDRAAEAVPMLERVSRSSDSDAVDVALLALAYARAGDTRRAIPAAEMAARSNSTDDRVYLVAGRALLEVDQPREAEPVLTRAAELSAEPAEALTLLATAKVLLGKRGEAISLLGRALAADPGYAPARAALARLR